MNSKQSYVVQDIEHASVLLRMHVEDMIQRGKDWHDWYVCLYPEKSETGEDVICVRGHHAPSDNFPKYWEGYDVVFEDISKNVNSLSSKQ